MTQPTERDLNEAIYRANCKLFDAEAELAAARKALRAATKKEAAARAERIAAGDALHAHLVGQLRQMQGAAA
jgi:hypothetical protein